MISRCAMWSVLVATLCAHATYAALTWEQREVKRDAEPGTKQVEASFVFTNTGEHDVTITSIRATCGCTTAELEKKTYAPGESGSIDSVFTIGDRVGEQKKHITIRTDDPGQAVTTLTFTLNVKRFVEMKPRFVYWRAGEDGEKTIELKVTHEKPIKVLYVTADRDIVDVTTEEATPGRLYRLKINPKPGATEGRATLRIVTDLENEAHRVFTAVARVIGDRGRVDAVATP